MADELGALVARYESDNGRRGRMALVLLLLGLVGTPLSVVLAMPAYNNSAAGDDVVPSVLIGCAVGAVIMGSWLGWLFLTRSGETFELRVDGLVHAYRGKRRVARWEHIVRLTDTSKDTALARMFGGDVSLQLKLEHGKPIHITGIVDNAEHLAMAVREAVENDNRPSSGRDTG